jgi:hypothetical protein
MYYRSGERNWVEAHCKNSGHTITKNSYIHTYIHTYIYTHTHIKIHHIHHLSLNPAAPGMFGTSFFVENVIEATT